MSDTKTETGLQRENLKRIFKFKLGNSYIELPDPGIKFTTKEVQETYSNHYPQLINAIIEEKGMSDDGFVYEFLTVAGTKG